MLLPGNRVVERIFQQAKNSCFITVQTAGAQAGSVDVPLSCLLIRDPAAMSRE
jgi:hypothetical protein